MDQPETGKIQEGDYDDGTRRHCEGHAAPFAGDILCVFGLIDLRLGERPGNADGPGRRSGIR
jgi:hypothetical protein